MKIALIVYHKNAEKIYPAHWLDMFKASILNQTYQDFEIVESNYGGGDYRIFEESVFDKIEEPTFVHAMNRLLDKCFNELGCDYVLNSNVDDAFSTLRIEKQLPFMEAGFDIVSSNFVLIKEETTTHVHSFDKVDIKEELDKDNNCLCHPVIAYSAKFWKHHRYVPTEIPAEDMLLWKRAINNGMKFKILEDVLCFHRLHDQSVCQSENR